MTIHIQSTLLNMASAALEGARESCLTDARQNLQGGAPQVGFDQIIVNAATAAANGAFMSLRSSFIMTGYELLPERLRILFLYS